MKSKWDQEAARQWAEQGELGLRVYSARLLGEEEDLVLHGGGNTSIKGEQRDIFGVTRRVLFVKGSGWDLKTIESAGFPAVNLDYLVRLGNLDALSDSEMMRQLRLALLDPTAPTPSVEAILHALIPHRVVDHTHADAVVTVSNTPDGETMLRAIYGDRVLILPYIMPGFILARQVAEATRNVDWQRLEGIVLMHHGIFTFAADEKTSYEKMIDLVSRAEAYLETSGATESIARGDYDAAEKDFVELARLRRAASKTLGAPALVRWDTGRKAVGFSALERVADVATRGPLTPDHTIHAKAFAALFGDDPESELIDFVSRYQAYFDAYASAGHQRLDCMPRYGVWRGKGMLYFAPSLKRLQIVRDIARHTLLAIQWGEALGGWRALPANDLFEVEYWELEQAKLKQAGKAPELTGRVALITGAASGIGKACVAEFRARGAVIVALDKAADIESMFADQPEVLGVCCDVTDPEALVKAVQTGVRTFGGIDMLVSNAGNFPAGARLAAMNDADWDQSLKLNLTSHMQLLRTCTPFLELGIDPAVVIVASKNVPAPGPGAGAYSVAKAGLTQLARVAALELGGAGIRVNVLHPNAVFDTGIWTEQVLAERAASYGLTVDQYRRNNVLKTEVSSRHVATLAATFCSPATAATTGAQIPVDGGNERVI